MVNHLCLDTNTWIYLANGTEPSRILRFLKEQVDKGRIVIIAPETVIQEWNANKEKAVAGGGLKHFEDAENAMKKLLQLLGPNGTHGEFDFLLEDKPSTDDKFQDVFDAVRKKKGDIKDAIDENIKLIDDLLAHQKTVRIPLNDTVKLKSSDFALGKKAPFLKKNSFADAVIVFGFIDYVEEKKIEGAKFVTYNVEDFCEKKEGKKFLHPDLEPEFIRSKSEFYTVVGKAINSIEKIISEAELQRVMELQDLYDFQTENCQVCDGRHGMGNKVEIDHTEPLVDERTNVITKDPNQFFMNMEDGSSQLPSSNSVESYYTVEVGECEWCGTEHFGCPECGELIPILDGQYNEEIECYGCDLKFRVSLKVDRKGMIEDREFVILDDQPVCAKCGERYIEDESHIGICQSCEDEYSYG